MNSTFTELQKISQLIQQENMSTEENLAIENSLDILDQLEEESYLKIREN